MLPLQIKTKLSLQYKGNGWWKWLGLILFLFTFYFGPSGAVAQTNITRVEYYIDVDPGFGNATNLSITPSAIIQDAIIEIDPATINEAGVHCLYVRAKNANGNWSLTYKWLFYKPYGIPPAAPALANMSKIEYYIDVDPGYGNGIQITLPDVSDLDNYIVPIDISNFPPGNHTFWVRGIDKNGKWSMMNKWLFNTSFLLPDTTTIVTKNITGDTANEVNKGIYKIATITPTEGANTLSGEVTTTETVDTTVPNYNGQPYVQRHYDITPSVNAANAQASVTLYFTQQDFDRFNTYITANNLSIPLLPTAGTDNGNARIIQYHGSYTGSPFPGNYSGTAIEIMANLVWDTFNNWWTVTIPVTGFSGFFLTTVNFALPLTLVEFQGRLQENAVTLQWLTSDEVNTNEFVIERSNQNTGFISIGKVPARSTAGTHQYSFTDTKPLAGNNFYRLKMTDKDGNFTYSKIVPIKINDAVFKLSVYPIPAKNILNVKTSSTGNNKITLQVTDLAGKLLLNKVTDTGNGESIISLNVSQLSTGTYFLKILSADGKENAVKKFVKQ